MISRIKQEIVIHTAKECEEHCQYSVDVDMWPQHSCNPVCMYLKKPIEEEAKMTVHLHFVTSDDSGSLLSINSEHVPRLHDCINLEKDPTQYTVFNVKWTWIKGYSSPTVTVYIAPIAGKPQ